MLLTIVSISEVSRHIVGVVFFVAQTKQLTSGLSEKDNSSIPLYVLLIPILFALFNIVMAYLGGLRYRKLKKESLEHEWLLRQKNNCLAMIEANLATPLADILSQMKSLYERNRLSVDSFKKIEASLSVAATRVEKLSQELKRSTLNITNESVEIIPFYRSATTLAVLATTGFVIIVINSVFATTDLISITFSLLAFQVLVFVLATGVVLITNRYKSISDHLVMHAKATIHLEQQMDLAKDHMISLVVKIISADIEDIKRTIGLFVNAKDQQSLKAPLRDVDTVISRLELLNNIDNRLIKSEVRVLNVEDVVEDAFRSFQKELNAKGIQVEHFHRSGAAKIQPAIVQDYALLKIAISEIFQNAITHAPAQSIIKVVSEHSLTSSSLSIIDQGGGFELNEKAIRPFAWEKSQQQDQHAGIGIGLYLADQIMHILGGEMQMTSKKKIGTTVKLTFTNNYVR